MVAVRATPPALSLYYFGSLRKDRRQKWMKLIVRRYPTNYCFSICYSLNLSSTLIDEIYLAHLFYDDVLIACQC